MCSASNPMKSSLSPLAGLFVAAALATASTSATATPPSRPRTAVPLVVVPDGTGARALWGIDGGESAAQVVMTTTRVDGGGVEQAGSRATTASPFDVSLAPVLAGRNGALGMLFVGRDDKGRQVAVLDELDIASLSRRSSRRLALGDTDSAYPSIAATPSGYLLFFPKRDRSGTARVAFARDGGAIELATALESAPGESTELLAVSADGSRILVLRRPGESTSAVPFEVEEIAWRDGAVGRRAILGLGDETAAVAAAPHGGGWMVATAASAYSAETGFTPASLTVRTFADGALGEVKPIGQAGHGAFGLRALPTSRGAVVLAADTPADTRAVWLDESLEVRGEARVSVSVTSAPTACRDDACDALTASAPSPSAYGVELHHFSPDGTSNARILEMRHWDPPAGSAEDDLLEDAGCAAAPARSRTAAPQTLLGLAMLAALLGRRRSAARR